MSRRHEEPLTFRPLHEGPVVCVREYHCRAHRGGPAAEEYSDGNSIVLLRLGAFSKHFGHRSVTADANQAVFFSKSRRVGTAHLWKVGGGRCPPYETRKSKVACPTAVSDRSPKAVGRRGGKRSASS